MMIIRVRRRAAAHNFIMLDVTPSFNRREK
jgi:hypothetical protein